MLSQYEIISFVSFTRLHVNIKPKPSICKLRPQLDFFNVSAVFCDHDTTRVIPVFFLYELCYLRTYKAVYECAMLKYYVRSSI